MQKSRLSELSLLRKPDLPGGEDSEPRHQTLRGGGGSLFPVSLWMHPTIEELVLHGLEQAFRRRFLFLEVFYSSVFETCDLINAVPRSHFAIGSFSIK